MEKSLVVVSRKWHEPFVRVDVTDVGIGITITMEDFISALEQETGVKLHAAAEKVYREMKANTANVM